MKLEYYSILLIDVRVFTSLVKVSRYIYIMSKIFRDVIHKIATVGVKNFSANEVIVAIGRKQKDSFYITDGYVKVYDLNSDGNIKTILILKKGDMFPLIWGFDHIPEVVYYYKAMGPVKTLSVETKVLRESLLDDPTMAREAQLAFVYMTWDLMERVKCLQMPYTQEKLIRLMPYLAAKLGVKKDTSTYELSIAITQEEIAQLLGATRESVSAHLSKLEEKNVISRKKSKLTIHMNHNPEEYIYDVWFEETV